jgi:hypothetical protein
MTDNTKVTSMRQRRFGAVGLALAVSTLATGCDVTNPGPIRDEFIGDETAQAGLIFGIQRQIAEVYTDNAFDMALIGREVFPGGQIGAWGNPVQIHAGHVEPSYDNGSFEELQTARFIAETAVAEFTAAGATDLRMHEAHLWGGYAYRILGEWWCDAVIADPDPTVTTPSEYFPGTSDPYFERAVAHFTAALGFADTPEEQQAARAGRASAHLWLGNWDEALADAAAVGETFTFVTQNDPSETPLYNYIAEANSGTFRSYTVQFSWFEDYYTNTGDPRTPWGIDPDFAVAVGSLSGYGQVPYKPQLKFTSRTQDVNLASGWEMKLVQAEAILRGAGSGLVDDAMDLINEVRTRNVSDNDDLPLQALTAADATEAWTHLKRERRIELWLEGRSAGDERRWADTNAPGTLDIPDWNDPSHPGYTPLFDQYPRDRLCLDVPDSERDRNPNVPAVG